MAREKYPCLENLHFSADKSIDVRIYNIDVMVEDRQTLAESLKNLTKVFLVNRPYNNVTISKEITRIDSVLDLEKFL